MVEPGTKAVIIDNGSGVVKAGMAGEDKPRAVFSCVVGKPKNSSVIPGTEKKDLYLGDEAQKLRGVLEISYPIEHGIVKDWDNMQKIWEHTLSNELRVDPKECAIMLTEAPMNPKANREQMIDIVFNTYGAKGFYVGIQAVLAMFSTGRTTGLVVDSGDGVTHTVPIYETYSIPHGIKKFMLAGRDVSSQLMLLLKETGRDFDTSAQFQITREIKEKMSYVSLDYKKDMDECNTKEWKEKFEKPYLLPDGNIMMMGSSRFRAPEILFQPTLCGKEYPGVHKLAYSSIMECDLDVRKPLCENVILSGGSTMFDNYAERLLNELKGLLPPSINVKVVAQPDRKYAVFIGAAQLANLSAFQNSWITKKEFEENGVSIVHRKCF